MYSNILNEGCPKRYMKLIHYMYTGVLYKCIQEFLQWPVPVSGTRTIVYVLRIRIKMY